MMPFYDLQDLPEREIVPGYRAVFIHGDHMTLAYWRVDAGAALPEHAHPHEQITNVIEGRFELTVEGETRVLEAGSTAVVPVDAAHAGRALTDCRIIDAFHPVREDYR